MSSEWTTVTRKQNKRKPQDANSGNLVKEILAALLSSRAYQPKEREPEWKCKACGFSNFATRFKCRDCLKPRQNGKPNGQGNQPNPQKGKGKGKGTGKPTVKPKQNDDEDDKMEADPGKDTSKPNPWQSKEDRRQKVTRLEKLLQFAELNDYPEEEIDEIRSKLKAATKQIEKEQPPGVLLETTIKYLERAKNRVEKAKEAVQRAKKDLEEAETQLETQEQEVKVTEARIEGLKLTVAGINNPSTTTSPTESWACTTPIPTDFAEMIEKAITNFAAPQHHIGTPGESEDEGLDPKRQRKAVEFPRTDLNQLWYKFQVTVAEHAKNLGNPAEQHRQQGEQDVVMRTSGE